MDPSVLLWGQLLPGSQADGPLPSFIHHLVLRTGDKTEREEMSATGLTCVSQECTLTSTPRTAQ